jgi:hypothetical protein
MLLLTSGLCCPALCGGLLQVLAEVLPLVEQCAAGGRPLRRLWDLAALADGAAAEGGSKAQ